MLPRSRICLVLAFATTLVGTTAFAQEKVVDEIVAMVDDQVLLRSDVDGLVFNVVQQNQIEYTEDLWGEALQNLIDQKVLAIHARRDTTIQIPETDVERLLDQRISQMSARVGGRAGLEQIYGKSVREIKESLRKDFTGQLMAEQLRSRKLSSIKITPSEVQEWFNRIPADSLPEIPATVRLAHIVRFPQKTEEAKRDAVQVLTVIRDSIVVHGGSFEELAKTFSEDPGSAPLGGRMEDSRLRDFVPEFAAVVSRAKPGEVSEIFETEFGLHILRLNRRRGDIVDVNHILVGFDRSKYNPTPAIELLSALRDSVVTHGVAFEALAKRHSEEASTASRGGRVVDPATGDPSLYVEALGPRWRSTLARLQIGEVSEPEEVSLLDGREAYHIVRLRDQQPAHKVDILSDYDLVRDFALRDKQNAVLSRWVDELRKDVFIMIRGKTTTGVARN